MSCHAGACVGGAALACFAAASCVAGACVAGACTGSLGLPGPPRPYDWLYVASADVDGDGKIDLVVANEGSDLVSVLQNLGNGAFAPPVGYPVGTAPNAVSSGDLDGDGKPDVVLSKGQEGTLGVLLNNGDGTFAPGVDYPAGTSPGHVEIADVDGDGMPDLVTVSGGKVLMLRNLGGGTFAAGVDLGAGPSPGAIMAGDLDGDGKIDVAFTRVGAFGQDHVVVLWNEGNGAFMAPDDLGYLYAAGAIAIADLNGDGRPDLALGLQDPDGLSSGVAVILNQGARTFSGAGVYYEPTHEGVYQVLPADLDGQGKMDLLALRTDGKVRVLKNDGSGDLTYASDFTMGEVPGQGLTADLDGDGKPDLAVASRDDTVHVLLNEGNDVLAAPVSHVADPTPPPARYDVCKDPSAIVSVDFDGDGRPDIAVVSIDAGSLSVLLNKGDGTFGSAQGYAVGAEALSLAAADLDGDGIADIAVTETLTNTVSVLLNDGHGAFAPAVAYPAGTSPTAVVAADFDGDGLVDLAVAGGSGAVSLLLNKGGGTFADPIAFDSGKSPWAIAAADFDGDGKPDLVVVNSLGDDVSVLLNQGGGSFAAAVHYVVDQQLAAPGVGPTGVVAGDLNGDGKPDLVVESAGLLFTLLLNNGDGTFAAPVYTPGAAGSIAMTDLNGDGKPDLVAGVGVFLGQGGTTFAPGAYYGQWDSSSQAAVADVNGDGRPDIVVSDFATSTVGVLLNHCLP